MKKIILFTFSLIVVNVFAQTSPSCGNAAQICPSTAISFPASVNDTAEVGPNYGCLLSQPNPSWFYFQVATAGDVIINISQMNTLGNGEDIDFICWGPFTSATTPCFDTVSLQSSAVDCSYSTGFTEVMNVTNAQAGEFYLLMVTNFSNIASTVEFNIDSTTTATLACANCVNNALANTPVCVGTPLNLFSTSHLAGGVYSWTGPNGFSSSLQNPTITTTTYSDEGYYYVNYTQDTTCNVTDSVFVDIIDCTIGIQENNSNPSAIKVYPNPTKDQLFISVDVNQVQPSRIVIMSVTGKIERMFNVQANNQRLYSINTSGLSPGIYFISIETEAGTTNKKIIIAE